VSRELTDEELIANLRDYSTRMELKAVDLLNKTGGYAKHSGQIKTIRLTYIDGHVITLPKRLEKHFDKQVFQLRPKRNH
jgi:hypothetical protein